MPKTKRCVIPKKWKKYWKSDFDDLTEIQRLEMVEDYICIIEDYERGIYTNRLKQPFFMSQREKAKAWEAERRRKGMEAKMAEEALHNSAAKIKQDALDDKLARFRSHKIEWLKDSELPASWLHPLLNLLRELGRVDDDQFPVDGRPQMLDIGNHGQMDPRIPVHRPARFDLEL